jgi:5-methylcytosine-specific restriction enzyme A
VNIEIYRYVRLILANIGCRSSNMGHAMMFIYGRLPVRAEMARLKTLKPQLCAAPSRLHRATDERSLDRRRLADTETRKLHKTARWQQLRWSVLVRDQFTCQICRRLEGDTSRLVCDHVEPHRGDVDKFWSCPFQTLCKPCHDGAAALLQHP